MATNLITNNFEYTTKLMPEWFTKLIAAPTMLAGGYLRIEPNVTKDLLIKKLSGGDTISQVSLRDCDWTPGHNIETGSKLLSLANFKINEEQCMEDLDSIFSQNVFSGQGGPAGANKTDWPNYDGFGDKVMHWVYATLKTDLDRIIIGGETNVVDTYQDGLLDKLTADSEAVKVSGTSIDATNVLDEVQKVIDAIPDTVMNGYVFDENLGQINIFVPVTVYNLLMRQMATIMNSNVMIAQLWSYQTQSLPNGKGQLKYLDINIVPVWCMPANTMIAAAKGNLIFATDLLSDTETIKVQNGACLKDENILYIKGQYRAGVDYVEGSEVVLYQA